MSRRRAFTLIELVVATVLASVLLAVLLTATATLARDRKRLAVASSASTPSETQVIVRLIRRDLLNARAFQTSPDGRRLQIVGFGAIAESTLATTGRLVEVEYQVRTAGDRPILVRLQRRRDDPTGADPWAELVAVGVTRMNVSGSAGDSSMSPPHVQLRIELGDRLIEEVIHLR